MRGGRLTEHPLVRIAHAYGNRRHRIDEAVAAGVDLIEADLRWRGGRVWVRHEHRTRFLPVLYNVGLKGIHRDGPWAANLRRLFLRLDVRPILLDELLDRVGQRCGILLDLKAGAYSTAAARAFVASTLAALDARMPPPRVDFCGSWPLLDAVRTMQPEQMVHYSVDSERDWTALQERLTSSNPPTGITIERKLLDETRAAILRRAGVEFYCWDVANKDDAQHAIGHGAAGIIADDLDMLATLGEANATAKEDA